MSTPNDPAVRHDPAQTWGGAFLLVIPGAALIGTGIGLLTDTIQASSLIGFGSGLLIWGLVVSLRKS